LQAVAKYYKDTKIERERRDIDRINENEKYFSVLINDLINKF